MLFNLTQIILLLSFVSITNSVRCYMCGSILAPCLDSKASTCEGASCGKFEAGFAGERLILTKWIFQINYIIFF